MDKAAARAGPLALARSFLGRIIKPLLALLFGVLLGCLILWLSGYNVPDFLKYLITGSLGSRSAIAATLRWSTPLILAGLGIAIGFRAGFFNVGVEGQLYVGAFAATWVGFTFSLYAPVHVAAAILAAILAGALWALVPAVLRFKLGANEVVTTLMLNYVAILLTEYLARYHFLALDASAESTATYPIAASARLLKLMPPYTVHLGLVIAVALALLLHFFIRRTRIGYELRVVGLSPSFARYGGVKTQLIGTIAFLLGGALGGICGATEILGVQGRFLSRFSPGFGFDGIVVALLAQNSPLGVIFGGLVLGALKAGGLAVERFSDVPRTVVIIVQGVIILLITAQGLFAFRGILKPVQGLKGGLGKGIRRLVGGRKPVGGKR